MNVKDPSLNLKKAEILKFRNYISRPIILFFKKRKKSFYLLNV